MNRASDRSLIWVPLFSAQADMGGLADSVLRIRKHLDDSREYARAMSKFWRRVRYQVTSLALCWETVRLFQDGLPDCGRKTDFVRELARAGSLNHQVLLELVEKGATLMGTESVDLLLEEYALAQQALLRGDPSGVATPEERCRERNRSLLRRRDQYIASRVNETLLCGETGLAFLGGRHSLVDALDRDIELVPLERAPHQMSDGGTSELRPPASRRSEGLCAGG